MQDNSFPGDCQVTHGLLQKAMSRTQDDERGYVWRNCLERARKVKLLLVDVDGVLTDGSITYNHEGREIKSFHSRDGLGLNIIQQIGVKVGLITARQSEAVARRAKDLQVAYVYQGRRDKIEAYNEILQAEELEDQQVAYMGDDWLDLPLLIKVGLAATVADAVPEVRKLAHYTTQASGGRGAVREVCDLILDAKGLRDKLLRQFLSSDKR
jgi:3-deoxy-D-manno-octulosonate 8-phosphate phosphatase (KDO 8-P phosphatase)